MLMTYCSPVPASDWTEADTKREYVYMSLHVADWLQTRKIARNPTKWYEKNNILGDHPTVDEVGAYFIGAAALQLTITYLLPSESRKYFQYLSIGEKAFWVGYNYSHGIRISFPLN
jgi:hypothetical protein